MVGNRLSGGKAPLIFKLASRGMGVVSLHWPLYCQGKSWIWRMDWWWNWSGLFGR